MNRRLIVEQPLEGEALAGLVTAEELSAAASFGASRRREYLAWRALVRRELGEDAVIDYNRVGAPVVTNREVFLSVAHCKGRIAVCLSDAPCAVDIESADRDFSRVVPRYLSSEERALSADLLFPAVAWCAKETLYKYSGRQELDLLCDLRIERVDLVAGRIVGRIVDEPPVEMAVHCEEGYVVVCIL